jgi:hypothetical protein
LEVKQKNYYALQLRHHLIGIVNSVAADSTRTGMESRPSVVDFVRNFLVAVAAVVLAY